MSPTTSNRRSPHRERLAIHTKLEGIERESLSKVWDPTSRWTDISTFCYRGRVRLIKVDIPSGKVWAFLSPQTAERMAEFLSVKHCRLWPSASLYPKTAEEADFTLSADPEITDLDRLEAHWNSFKLSHGGQVIPGDYRWHKANQGQREARVLAIRPWANEYLLEYVMPKGTSALVVLGGLTGEHRQSVSYGKLPKYWLDEIMERDDAIPSDGCLPHGFEWGNPQRGGRATVARNRSVYGNWEVVRYLED